MGNSTSKAKASGMAALEVKARLSVEVLVGSAAVAMTYLMYRCMVASQERCKSTDAASSLSAC
jgi:hypothetical protein